MKRLSKQARKDLKARRRALQKPVDRGGIRITLRGMRAVKRALRYARNRGAADPRNPDKAVGFDSEREGFILWSLRDRRWHHTKPLKRKVGFSIIEDLVDKKLIYRKETLTFKGVTL